MANKPNESELLSKIERLEAEIRAREKSENAIRNVEKVLMTILETIEDGYYEADARGYLVFVNASFCRIFGYPYHEMIGINLEDVMDPQSVARIQREFGYVYTSGKPLLGFQSEITTKDGILKDIEASVSLVKEGDGRKTGFCGIVRDITPQKKLEKELIHTKNFLQNVLESSVDGIITTDLHGIITYTTPFIKNFSGYEVKEIIGKKIYECYLNGKDDARAIMTKLNETNELSDHELKFVRKDGSLVNIDLSASLIKNEAGEVIGTLGVFRDVTEKKYLESKLRHAQKMQAVGTLAGGIAHHFNNLLMAIQGYAGLMLMQTDPSHPHYRMLRNIEKQVQSGSNLTRQLNEYAREERYDFSPTTLEPLVKQALDDFALNHPQIRLHARFTEKQPRINAHRDQLTQVFANIMTNAADAMPEGGDLTVETRLVSNRDMSPRIQQPKVGNYAMIRFRDTGTGMEPQVLERIFEPFFSTKDIVKGTGLGLTTAYGIITAHEGYIDVDTQKGHGTSFNIYLPLLAEAK